MEQTFRRITQDIITHPLFLRLRQQPHHGGENTVFDHSVDTARCAYRLARWFNMGEARVQSVTRAAMLHDFFGYDWQGEGHRRFMRQYAGFQRLKRMHAFIHGARAARRADRVFHLSQEQRAAIASHMFPLAPLPRTAEAWVLTLADKLVASKEMGQAVYWYLKRLTRWAVSHS